ncbi:hypothetical protein ACOSQ4_013167 [Xanthoceras sorbifolium]
MDELQRKTYILLGRLFMVTAKTIINVQNRKLSMTVLRETVEFQDLLELERELEEAQRLGSTRANDDPETGLRVEEKQKLQVETQPCSNKLQNSKPNFDENGRNEELQLRQMGDIDPILSEQRRQARIAGHAIDNDLDVH